MAEITTIARPYAQAVFKLAAEQKALKRWSEMLGLAAAVATDPEMAKVIDSPRLTGEQVLDIFFAVCGDKLNDAGKNMVRVLADNGRLNLLPEVAALFEIERAQAEGTLEAEVVTAMELTESQKKELAAALKKRLGREISLNVKVDGSLLGGAIIRAGDMVIDGSAVSRLDKLGSELMR
ncbi:MAG: F0F1 ATP synthase subunit delta [Gammaproteobacteria bacterium]|nr:F0F1 ATP synthase subunit delta [Gammaproteobacteria bacterium]